jgi:hypothetical protein
LTYRDAISAASRLSKWLAHVYGRGDLFEKRRRLMAEWDTLGREWTRQDYFDAP